MTQRGYISKLCIDNPDAVIIGSLGTICYDLDLIEHKHIIAIRGAMGAALGCGLGYALSTDKQVIVIIGEGALLMHLGSLSTILRHDLKNLRIIVINNGRYQSCGGQQNNYQYIGRYIPVETFTPEPNL